jgi:hypothetical protein
MHNILNHEMQLNKIYLFRATQRIDSLNYKDQLLNNVKGHKLYL